MNLLVELFANLGMSWEMGITIILLVGGLVFYAADFKIGAALHMVMFGLEFIALYLTGNNYAPPLILFFIALVMLTLSLYAVAKQTSRGAFI